ncbi:hypothetical protein ACIQC9_06795 [Brevundimonas sp. NPDC092305]|uniref:hypothetical protein n=1 Tax=Brevundimonas sp. NPDC092305 TaxID=3363957 RepID=UPI00381B0E36
MYRAVITIAAAASVSLASPVFAQTGSALILRLYGELEAKLRQEGTAFTRMRAVDGFLPNTGQNEVFVPIEAGGRYALIGLCDENCVDLDLTAINSSGVTVASDLGPDDEPVLDLGTDAPGVYRIQTKMADCSAARCAYSLRLYRWD